MFLVSDNGDPDPRGTLEGPEDVHGSETGSSKDLWEPF